MPLPSVSVRVPLVALLMLHLPVLMLPTSAEMKPPDVPTLTASVLRGVNGPGRKFTTPGVVSSQVSVSAISTPPVRLHPHGALLASQVRSACSARVCRRGAERPH
jgi:hypothetical protein